MGHAILQIVNGMEVMKSKKQTKQIKQNSGKTDEVKLKGTLSLTQI